MNIHKGKRHRPRRILLYGTKGIGKSTWAKDAGALFINIEDGLNDIDCDSTDWLRQYDQVVDAVGWLIANPVSNPAIAVDSADWLQRIIFDLVAKERGKDSVSDIGYAKGYDAAAGKLEYILEGLDRLRLNQGKHIIFLAHEQVTRFSKPGGDTYDRYSPDLHKEMAGVLGEWVDELLFASYRVFTKPEDLGFNKTRQIAVGGQERYIRTTETAAVIAKNRLGLPDELPMDWAAYAKHFPAPAGQAPAPVGNVAGIVVNGSSKVGVKV